VGQFSKMGVVAIAGLVTAGCISIYRQPPADAPSAEIEYRKPVAGVGIGITQSLGATSSPACEKISFIGDFDVGTAMLGMSGRRMFRAAAGERIYFHSETYSPGGGNASGTINYRNVCVNISSFVPEAGKRYAVVQYFTGRSCTLDIIRLEDDQPPPTFIRHPVEAACTKRR